MPTDLLFALCEDLFLVGQNGLLAVVLSLLKQAAIWHNKASHRFCWI